MALAENLNLKQEISDKNNRITASNKDLEYLM
jgi:hypothetical protein